LVKKISKIKKQSSAIITCLPNIACIELLEFCNPDVKSSIPFSHGYQLAKLF